MLRTFRNCCIHAARHTNLCKSSITRLFTQLGVYQVKQMNSYENGQMRQIFNSCVAHCSKNDRTENYDHLKSGTNSDEFDDLWTDIPISDDLKSESVQDNGATVDLFSGDFLVEDKSECLPGAVIKGIRIPTEETHKALINGVPYMELPIAHIKATWQNTHVSLSNHSGTATYALSTGGTVGFRNAKKRTNVAAQSAGLAVGKKVKTLGICDIRICFNGIGQSRFAACKGLEQAGLNIVSLTDNTRMPWGAYTPRKRRRC